MTTAAPLTARQISGVFPQPGAEDSKYTRGVVGLITGSEQYPGAGILSVSAASSAGVGYVRYNGPEASVRTLLGLFPEVVFSASADDGVDAWVLGSGFAGIYSDDDPRSQEIRTVLTRAGTRTDTHVALHTSQPYMVVDAGALESFATLTIDDTTRQRCILTPHTGEAGRLCTVLGLTVDRTYIEVHRAEVALYLAEKLHCTVVLKGARTLIASYSGELVECPPATHWLATAGTGDCLAGIMGALFALNHHALCDGMASPVHVAAGAVCVHSLSAGLAARDTDAFWKALLGEGRQVPVPDVNTPAASELPHHVRLLDMVQKIPQAMAELNFYTQQ
ncbi:ADP-dependent NAD(P)H-hydrate dehydratase [Alloscardovia criceti]|uniref:ADP-dependent NAD(P)H-hydrate dehydratase n=1 Tax=Alloscardovia criceti TaxID=356828 RepID=UPI00037BFFDF|nr:ADP/ATP-dependent (S)-NAD(P)H-hydrate dehydratase [Alloscardovia criceti]